MTQQEDVEAVWGDLIYCINQAFCLTKWRNKNPPSAGPVDWELHDALLGTVLINVRMLNDFLNEKRGQDNDITVYNLRRIGYQGAVSMFLSTEEKKKIGRLFAHITANRNEARFAKEPFPISRYLRSIVESFTPILTFFLNRIEGSNPYQASAIEGFLAGLPEELKIQEGFSENEEYFGQRYYMSGNWISF